MKIIKSFKSFILNEEISALEANTAKKSIQTVINGDRNVGFIGTPSDRHLKLIKKNGLNILNVPRLNNKSPIIFYRQESEQDAKELFNIASKYDGYLSINATEKEHRTIGKILGYNNNDIDDFIVRNKKSFSE